MLSAEDAKKWNAITFGPGQKIRLSDTADMCLENISAHMRPQLRYISDA